MPRHQDTMLQQQKTTMQHSGNKNNHADTTMPRQQKTAMQCRSIKKQWCSHKKQWCNNKKQWRDNKKQRCDNQKQGHNTEATKNNRTNQKQLRQYHGIKKWQPSTWGCRGNKDQQPRKIVLVKPTSRSKKRATLNNLDNAHGKQNNNINRPEHIIINPSIQICASRLIAVFRCCRGILGPAAHIFWKHLWWLPVLRATVSVEDALLKVLVAAHVPRVGL